MHPNYDSPPPRVGAKIWACLVVLALTATLGAASCTGEDSQADPDDVRRYFDNLDLVIAHAYGRFDLLLQIVDDEDYAERLTANSTRFTEAAEALAGVSVPRGFDDEHSAYVDALDHVAGELTEQRRRIDAGEDAIEVVRSSGDGPLAEAFDGLEEACNGIARRADESGVYDGLGCGGDPYFIEAVQPAWSQRVFVNRCCGFADPRFAPLEIFYGSDEPFDRTLDHYRQELEERGFEMTVPPRSAELYGSQTYRFAKADIPGCFWIQEFSEDFRLISASEEDIQGLDDYPHAYAATYLRICAS